MKYAHFLSNKQFYRPALQICDSYYLQCQLCHSIRADVTPLDESRAVPPVLHALQVQLTGGQGMVGLGLLDALADHRAQLEVKL